MHAALLLVAAACGVYVVSAAVAPRLRAEERAALALALGPTALGWCGLSIAALLGVGARAASLAGLAWALLAGVLCWRPSGLRAALGTEWRDLAARLRGAPRRAGAALAVLALCLTVSGPIFARTWIERPDGSLATGTANNLGDVVLHIGIAHAFVWGDNLPPDDVIWAGRRLAYPFLPDFSSGLLIAAGWGTGPALWVPGLSMLVGTLVLLGALAWRATGRLAASLLPGPLLLLGGGSQYLLALAGAAGGSLRWPSAAELAARQIVWQNPLLSLLLPQRSTLSGLALIVAVLLLVWVESDSEGGRRAWLRMGAIGLLCGLLPLVFAHGYLALALILPLALMDRLAAWRGLLALGVGAAVPAVPQVLWLSGELTGGGFIHWLPGWMAAQPPARPGVLELVGFWLWNLGPFVPLAAAAAFLAPRIGLRRGGFFAAAWIAFLLPSLWSFAPWPWDNTKLFVIWLSLSLIPVSALLAALSARGRRGLVAAAVLTLALCASGARDVGRALLVEEPYPEYTSDQRAAALYLRRATAPRTVVLERPHWAQLARLAGRRSAIGYPGHLWTHGIRHVEREQAVESFYRSLAPGAEARPGQWRAFLEGLGVDAVVVGPSERGAYGADPARLRQALPELFRVGQVVVFAVPRALDRVGGHRWSAPLANIDLLLRKAAEPGILVFGTLHTNSAPKTIDRLIDAFPSDEQPQVRVMLPDSLRAVVAQQLLKTADGKGRCAANEILIAVPALSNLIREGKIGMIQSLMQTGSSRGC